jgi:hypothetical protein
MSVRAAIAQIDPISVRRGPWSCTGSATPNGGSGRVALAAGEGCEPGQAAAHLAVVVEVKVFARRVVAAGVLAGVLVPVVVARARVALCEGARGLPTGSPAGRCRWRTSQKSLTMSIEQITKSA